MLINLTNHPSEKWGDVQRREAERMFGRIMDVPFPTVNAFASEEEIAELAEMTARKVVEVFGKKDIGVLVQGEFTLAFAVIRLLDKMGIPCYAACSDRRAVETVDENGVNHKQVEFCFVRFRQYVL